jgi:hypothetical protein
MLDKLVNIEKTYTIRTSTIYRDKFLARGGILFSFIVLVQNDLRKSAQSQTENSTHRRFEGASSPDAQVF